MTYDDEDSLIQAVQRFEEQALIEVYDRYNSAIYRYASRLTGIPSLAEECVSETFFRFLKSIKQGKRINNRLQAYLFRIAHNYIVDIYRKKFSNNFYKKIYSLWLEVEVLKGKMGNLPSSEVVEEEEIVIPDGDKDKGSGKEKRCVTVCRM